MVPDVIPRIDRNALKAVYKLDNGQWAEEFRIEPEQTVWPQGTGQWLAVAGLGLLPVGAAFYAWDFGIKRGDIRVLGTASYVAPLLSTLILIASGVGRADWRIALACILITGGAVLAAKDLLFARAHREGQAEE